MTINKLKIPIAFLSVVVIWTTTPLAVQWSSTGAPLTSALFRMLIGMMFCLAVLGIRMMKLPLNAAARRLYVVGGLAIYTSMSLIYLAAQQIPSGWIAIIFGLSPLITGVISRFVEPEATLTTSRIIGILLGLFGLFLVFEAGLAFNNDTVPGILLMLGSTFLSASSSVLIRHLTKQGELLPMQITTGSLVVAIPCFAITAFMVEPASQVNFSDRALYAILYLGMIATGIGFTLYYFLLRHLPASKVALVALITPITALLLGNLINNEPVIAEVWMGAACVCIGLTLYEYKPRFGLRRI